MGHHANDVSQEVMKYVVIPNVGSQPILPLVHIRRIQPGQAVYQVSSHILLHPHHLTNPHRKSEALQRSLNQMEQKLEVVLRSLNNPALASLSDVQLPQGSDSSPSSSPRVPHIL